MRLLDSWWADQQDVGRGVEVAAGRELLVDELAVDSGGGVIKNIKRTGRGYRSHANYQSRIMLYKAARSAA